MEIKGVVFDFNGTLFWDTDKHEKAWRYYSELLRGYPFTDEELHRKALGRTNIQIIEYLTDGRVNGEKALKYSLEKEKVYREMFKEDPESLKLAPGAVELLDCLVEKGIRRNIATGSESTNVEFYIETFKLEKWFEIDKIVFDDGNLAGKPAPDIFLKASERIGLKPEQCMVFEDTYSGIEAARRAGMGLIIAIGPEEKHAELRKIPGVDYVIKDYFEFDRSVFS